MRYPAALVINAHALRTLTLRRELLLTVRADGSPDGSLRLLGAQDGLQRQGEDADGAHALVPPLVGMRGPAVRARLTPPPVRRRRRTCAAIRPLFDDVTARDLADGLCGRAVKLSADFPDLELSTSISATATAERSARISR